MLDKKAIEPERPPAAPRRDPADIHLPPGLDRPAPPPEENPLEKRTRPPFPASTRTDLEC